MKKIVLSFLVLLSGFTYYIVQTPANNSDTQKTFYGNIENRTQKLSFPFLGTIEQITKDEGQSFKKSELLASLDTTNLHYQLQQLQAQIEAETLILQKLQSGYRTEEIAQAKAAMQEAKAVLAGAKDTYTRQKQLYDHKSTAEQNYILAKTAYEKAEATYNKTQSYYTLLKSGYQKEDIQAQKKKIDALQMQKKSLEYNLSQAALIAPQEGVVLTRYVEEKSVVTPAQTVLEIALQDHYWVRAYVSEADLGELKQGQKMLIYSDAREEPYNGYIGFISAIAEFTPKNIQTPELRPDLVYRFRVIITNPTSALKQGMPVTITTR